MAIYNRIRETAIDKDGNFVALDVFIETIDPISPKVKTPRTIDVLRIFSAGDLEVLALRGFTSIEVKVVRGAAGRAVLETGTITPESHFDIRPRVRLSADAWTRPLRNPRPREEGLTNGFFMIGWDLEFNRIRT